MVSMEEKCTLPIGFAMQMCAELNQPAVVKLFVPFKWLKQAPCAGNGSCDGFYATFVVCQFFVYLMMLFGCMFEENNLV